MSPSTELRAAMIAHIKADANVLASPLGSPPRVFNRAPPDSDPRSVFPYVVIQSTARAYDTTTEFGAEHDVEIFVLGESEGDKEGEAIFWALRQALRAWVPAAFSTHSLRLLVFRFEDIRSEEGGKRYYGVQRWRAVTEEL